MEPDRDVVAPLDGTGMVALHKYRRYISTGGAIIRWAIGACVLGPERKRTVCIRVRRARGGPPRLPLAASTARAPDPNPKAQLPTSAPLRQGRRRRHRGGAARTPPVPHLTPTTFLHPPPPLPPAARPYDGLCAHQITVDSHCLRAGRPKYVFNRSARAKRFL
jgi:hypothetical protein